MSSNYLRRSCRRFLLKERLRTARKKNMVNKTKVKMNKSNSLKKLRKSVSWKSKAASSRLKTTASLLSRR